MPPSKGLITIRLDDQQLRHDLSALKRKHVPQAMCNVVNRLVKNSITNIQDEMKQKFKDPTPWTLGTFKPIFAKHGQASGAIVTRDLAPNAKGGTAAARYLFPDVFGGEREMKASEKRLSSLSGGQEWIPGRDAPLDSKGNMKKGEIIRILSDLGQLKKRNQSTPKTRSARTATGQYFVFYHKGSDKPAGICKRTGQGKEYREILRFIPTNAHYRPILPLQRIVDNLVTRRAPRYVSEELEKTAQKRWQENNTRR